MLSIIMSIENDEDRAFVEKIYDSYFERMYLLAYDILKSHHDAQDCVHDTIVKIIDKVERFKQAKQADYLKKLIVIACRNTAIDKYNEKKKRNRAEFSTTVYGENEDYEIMDIPDETEDIEKIVLSEYNCHYLMQLVDQLDFIYRDILILKSFGFSNDEIAGVLNIPTGLVRKRYSRARVKILELGGKELHEYQ